MSAGSNGVQSNGSYGNGVIGGFDLDEGIPCHVRVKVVSVPPGTPTDDAIYIAGSFNGWNARDEASRLTRDDQGGYGVDITTRVGAVLEYKFTRGSWASVETAPGVENIENRRALIEADGQEIAAAIGDWHDRPDDLSARQGLAGTIEAIRAFHVPQLGVSRKIWVYLPHDYATTDRRYPVIYMHEGQNLFDAASSTARSSHDAEGAIIVAPDNGGDNRAGEYSPWRDPEKGIGGQGDQYVDFLVQTLKPYIDVRFRTLRARQYTGILGSSMGGLISLYAALKYPATFARVGALSPSLDVAGRRIFDVVREWGKGGQLQRAGRLQVFLCAGSRDARGAVDDTVEMFHLLQRLGFSPDDVELKIDDKGQTREATWAEFFDSAYVRLFAEG